MTQRRSFGLSFSFSALSGWFILSALSSVSALGVLSAAGGCDATVRSGPGIYRDDLGEPSAPPDLLPPPEADLLLGPLNLCGDRDPGCTTTGIGPPMSPFPLGSDGMPDPKESDNGVDRDASGYISLSQTHASFDFLWIANSADWGSGTVSKINSKTVREVARYFSVTCLSNAGGSRKACDGTNGCCVRDDNTRFTNRANGKPAGPYQSVNVSANSPSRTAVDFNGDIWVANRAFGTQSSVTKIANDLVECTDRNGTPGIQTSSDVNNDGIIDTDCNKNGIADDVADVMGKACANGMKQEYYGLDDECVLFTTNTNVSNQYGRPLALGRGAMDFGPADAWAGTYQDGKFFRVDGVTGQIKVVAAVPFNPYGCTIDSKGILWATAVGGGLAWLDTGNPQPGLAVRNPAFGLGGYGITLDRDQNVWVGGYPTLNAYRYTPDRSNGLTNLSKGFWTMISNVGTGSGVNNCTGRGIAADSRTANLFYVWMACHVAPYIARLDASSIPLPIGADKTVDGSAMPMIHVGGSTIMGAGVDAQQNIWSIAGDGAVATRIKVDAMGAVTTPSLAGTPSTGCPVGMGDWCSLDLASNKGSTAAGPYTYSDFTGFGLRNFTNPAGTYSYVVAGCTDQGAQIDTRFARVNWDSVVPANTNLVARARSGPTAKPDMSWGNWTGSYTTSPADLTNSLMPEPAKYMQVEFDLSSMDKASSPKLKAFSISYDCPKQPG